VLRFSVTWNVIKCPWLSGHSYDFQSRIIHQIVIGCVNVPGRRLHCITSQKPVILMRTIIVL